jgi:3-hydroxyisobutyrate dehydrogenase
MVGGDQAAFERALPAIQAFGKLIKHVGTSGAGFAVKAVNNMLLAVNLWSVAEGFTTLKAHGVNLTEALDCINASSGKSGVTETVLPQRILNRSFPVTFGLPLLAKDTGIALDLVRDANLPAPVIALVQSLIQAASLTAEENSDFSAAIKMYESWSKITLE